MEMGTRAPAGEGDRDGLTYPNGRAPKREKRRLPPRTCCLAVVLTLIGSLLLVVSLVALATQHDAMYPLFFLTFITLLPGSYASWHLVGIYQRWPGYDNMVVFSDDLELV